MSNATTHMPYECCCPHCPCYAREGYAQFKTHVKLHLDKDGKWTCPACQKVFGKEDMRQYMRHLEEYEGFITKKKGVAGPTDAAKWVELIAVREKVRNLRDRIMEITTEEDL
jgi:hypothetical protein